MNPWLERRSADGQGGARGFNSTRDDSEYQRDRARIIHSASFRSLQSKTQVLGLGESDFYRTRLTHSLEVAQIGSGICEWLRDQGDIDRRSEGQAALIPSFGLIEAICLAHDIGHSPFGHGGEIAMNTLMRDHGGFEANAQTLRILARLGEYSPHDGLDLTRRTMLGTIKYPALYSRVCRYAPVDLHDSTPTPPPQAQTDHRTERFAALEIPPKCLYDSESDVLDWLLAPFESADRERFLSVELPTRSDKRLSVEPSHGKTRFKPFDTSIMELADDIAYGVHDLEDALALGLVERGVWMEQVSATIQSLPDNPIRDRLDELNNELFSNSAKSRKHAISRLVGYFIHSTNLETDEAFSHPLLRLQARMEPTAYRLLKLLKEFVMHHVILRPELQMLQYKGQQVIMQLFRIFLADPERLLPKPVLNAHGLEGRRAIADFLAGLTDVSAGRLYHKLSSPASGSIFDRP